MEVIRKLRNSTSKKNFKEELFDLVFFKSKSRKETGNFDFDWYAHKYIQIPDGVTEIDECAFSESNFIHINIPNSVTIIRNFAFSDCINLKHITIPNSVLSIEDYAFSDCKFTDINLPNSITYLGTAVFKCCEQLNNIILSNSVKTINTFTFEDCINLKHITIPKSVTSIKNFAFWKSGLTSITIPESVLTLGEYAFSDCNNLSSISLPKKFEKDIIIRGLDVSKINITYE